MTKEVTPGLLKEMARLSVLSGRISETQSKNLQYFPLVFFESVKEVKIDYDLTPDKSMGDVPTHSNSLVSYYLTLDESKNDNLEKRYLALEKSVRTLFWTDIVVEVYFNDQIKYKSKNNGL
jgi:hypothetical protein